MLVKTLANETKLEPTIETAIKALIADKMEVNSDGFYLQNLADSEETRCLDLPRAKTALATLAVNNLIIHARLATAGLVNLANVQGFTIGDWQFTHNGQVYGLSKITDTKSDSLILFEQLVENLKGKIKPKHIAKAIRKTLKNLNFWGRCTLYDKINDRMFLFGDWQTYLVLNKYLLFSSGVLAFDKKDEVKINGLSFKTSGNHAIAVGSLNGIGVIENYTSDEFQYKPLGQLDTFASYQVRSTPVGFQGISEINEPAPDYWRGIESEFWAYDRYGTLTRCFEDEFGIHDTHRQCCLDSTCDDFEEFNEIHRQPLEV